MGQLHAKEKKKSKFRKVNSSINQNNTVVVGT